MPGQASAGVEGEQESGAERGASGSGARVNMRITSKEFAALAADAVEPGDEFFHHYYNLDSVKLKRSTPAAGTGEDDDDEEAEVDAFIQGLEDGEG